MDRLLPISQASDRIGVSIDTIRRWEKRGLIRSRRTEGNHRLFDLAEVERVARQQSGQNTQSMRILKDESVNSEPTSIELFAGCGGTALGLEHAGFKHLLLNELDKDAVSTLRSNRPDWNIVSEDVRQVNFEPYKGKVDLVQGGFPCQAFSYAGKKMGFSDTRGTLFYDFARAIVETMPKVAVGENVRGLLRHDGGRTLSTMLEVLRGIRDANGIGYKVETTLLRSQYLDVPQKRERLLIVAVREDIFDGSFHFPEEKDYVISLREAIADSPASIGAQYPEKKFRVMEMVPPGGNWRDLPEEVKNEYMGGSLHLGGGKTGIARRLSWNEPSLTLTCAPAQKQTERCHPEETRPLNIREYARIQTFPDSWNFQGSLASQYKQIGNAVPVNLAYHIGQMVKKILKA